MIFRRCVVLVCVVFAIAVGATPAAAEAGRRVALVIGNGNYVGIGPGGRDITKLPNPVRDAQQVSDMLSQAGFEVTRRTDIDSKKDFDRVLADFSRSAAEADVALVFYGGHGIEVDGINYLVPTGARLVDPGEVPATAVSATAVLRALSPARRLKILVLDACRDNPYKKYWPVRGEILPQTGMGARSMGTGERGASVARGLTAIPGEYIERTGSAIVAFATSAGEVASDGVPGQGSPLVVAMTKVLPRARAEKMDLTQFFSAVRDQILNETGDKQVPWRYSSVGERDATEPVFPERTVALAGRSLPDQDRDIQALRGAQSVAACQQRTELQLREPGTVEVCRRAVAERPEDADLQSRLGVAQLLLDRSYVDAFASLSRAALRGDARGEAWLGDMHERGLAALPADKATAADYYRRSITGKVIPSAAGFNNLGLLYLSGWGNEPANPQRAMALFQQGARFCLEPNRDPARCYAPALFNLGRMQVFSASGADATVALGYLERAASLDFLPALVAAGHLAERGIGTDCDAERAVRAYRIAADRGDPYGLAFLGRAHERGIGGVRRNLAEAASYYRRSAAEGNAYGQAYLGRLYMREGGVRGQFQRDLREARRLLELSANSLNPAGQSGLADLLLVEASAGPDVSAERQRLLVRAADAGDPDARKALGRPDRKGPPCPAS
jgi:uncharacterized caspase-like protein/TPR repeat protein